MIGKLLKLIFNSTPSPEIEPTFNLEAAQKFFRQFHVLHSQLKSKKIKSPKIVRPFAGWGFVGKTTKAIIINNRIALALIDDDYDITSYAIIIDDVFEYEIKAKHGHFWVKSLTKDEHFDDPNQRTFGVFGMRNISDISQIPRIEDERLKSALYQLFNFHLEDFKK